MLRARLYTANENALKFCNLRRSSSIQLGNEETHLYGPCEKFNASLSDFLIAAGDVCRLRQSLASKKVLFDSTALASMLSTHNSFSEWVWALNRAGTLQAPGEQAGTLDQHSIGCFQQRRHSACLPEILQL